VSGLSFTESVVEEAALAWLEALGYAVLHGPAIAAGTPATERGDPNYRDVVLGRRLHQALVRLNPDLPFEALEGAYRKLMRADAPALLERNRAVHGMLVDGVTVEYRRTDGSIAGALARVLEFDGGVRAAVLAVRRSAGRAGGCFLAAAGRRYPLEGGAEPRHGGQDVVELLAADHDGLRGIPALGAQPVEG
jgi:hypothetical protein